MEHKLEAADLAALEAIAPGRVFTGGQTTATTSWATLPICPRPW